tara:strand:- start:259 stop:570 length:312 start_codon:yes stop_codon:yes gene_type:complete
LAEETWSIIKYKPKEGYEEEFIEALKQLYKMMKNNKQYDYLNDFIKIEDTGEYVQIARMPSIDALIDGQIVGLDWLDSIDHLLEKYPEESRTEAFSGIKIPMD